MTNTGSRTAVSLFSPRDGCVDVKDSKPGGNAREKKGAGAFRFVLAAPANEQNQLTSAMRKADGSVTVRPIRLKRGIAEVIKELAAAAPILLQVAADSLTCVDFLMTYVRGLPRERSATIRIVIGKNKLDLSTSEPSIVKEAIREFCRETKAPSPGRK
jgi:hypothetical protein